MTTDEEREASGLALRKQAFRLDQIPSVDEADDFTRDWQSFMNKVCWGEIWQRPEFSLATRSLLTLAVLATEGRLNEIKTHTRVALNNGCTPAQIREVFFHVGLYAGVPAGWDAIRTAHPVIQEAAGGP